MKQLVLTFLILSTFTVKAQDSSFQGTINAMNDFGKHIGSKPNLDSALYCIRKVASNTQLSFYAKTLLHDQLAQTFVQKDANTTKDTQLTKEEKNQRAINKELLARLVKDSLKVLSDAARPIFLLAQIQDSENNIDLLKSFSTSFIDEELALPKFYTDKTGRYGLMIYQVISKKPELAELSQQLFKRIKTALEDNQIPLSDTLSRPTLSKRAWYRYVYAFVNYSAAETTENPQQKEKFLKAAYEYSPDLIDQSNSSSYNYDPFFLSGKESYQLSYLNYLSKNSTDKKLLLDTHLNVALINPKHKNKLRDYYGKNFADQKTFNDYWLESIENKARPTPMFSVNFLDKKTFSTKEHAGRWVLLDFWGTWCGPCREEHPDLQKFYKSYVLKNSQSISLVTIACRDKEDKVVAYMKEKKFSFPVVMSDNTVEEIYKIQSYPSKVLITPNGKYVNIPFGVNWQEFVKNYSEI